MASTYSSNLGIELIGTGDQSGTWGSTTNTNLGTLVEQAISGYVTQAVTTGADTTITIPNGSSGVARNMYIELTGSGGASTNLIVPANKKLYFIFNNTSSGQVTVKVAGQTGISVPNGKKMVLVSNGTDIVTAENYVASLSSDNLSLTGNLTLSGGTANGVLYLNGSKVATSGSALVFDGTNVDFGTVGAKLNFPTTSSSTKNYVGGAADGFSLEMVTQRGAIQPISYKQDYSVGHVWSLTGTDAMALTSTGLGIGTASPVSKLHVVQTAASEGLRIDGDGGGYAFVVNGGTDRTSRIRALSIGAAYVSTTPPTNGLIVDGNVGIGTASPAGKLTVKTGTNENLTVLTGGSGDMRLSALNDAASATVQLSIQGSPLYFRGVGGAINATLDSSGNLGLGVTPSAWSIKALQVNNSSIANDSNDIYLQSNAFFDGAWRYINTAEAAQYYQVNGSHVWRSAPSWNGTGSDIISFTQAMTLDADGDLGVGTTNPTTVSNYRAITVNGTNGGILDLKYGDTLGGRVVGNSGGLALETGGATIISFQTDGSERARIDSSGNLGVGIAPATTSRRLVVYGSTSSAAATSLALQTSTSGTGATDGFTMEFDGTTAYLWNYENNALIFGTNNTERARIDSSGNLLVGTTGLSGRLRVDSGSGGIYAQFNSTNANGGYVAFTSSGTVQGDIGTAAQIVSGGAATDFGINARGSRALIFGTNETERGRFTSGGAFCVGSTDYATAIVLAKSTAAATSVYNSWNSATSGTRYHFEFRDDAGATSRGSITTDGANTAYNTSSDRRLKQNIIPCADAGMVIDGIEVVEFDWKSGSHTRFGMIAQDLHLVAPEAVKTGDDGEEVSDAWGVDYSKLVPMLVKELQSVRARLAALEAQ